LFLKGCQAAVDAARHLRDVGFRSASGSFCANCGNWDRFRHVYKHVKRQLWAITLLIVGGSVAAVANEYFSAKQKVDSIESDRLRPGTHVTLSYPELTAWVEKEAPRGVRNPRLRATERDLATGTALIDFAQLERSQGRQPGWLMSKLLEGERPVAVTARIRSSAGRATVDLQRVEISGIAIDGRTLDFLIQNFLLAMYPSAVIGKPFELGHRIERLDIAPAAVGVVIGR
jgi:hypothetical protein